MQITRNLPNNLSPSETFNQGLASGDCHYSVSAKVGFPQPRQQDCWGKCHELSKTAGRSRHLCSLRGGRP
jgi:hypothetical protein